MIPSTLKALPTHVAVTVALTTLNTDWAMLAPLRCGASPSDWLSSTSTLKCGSLASLQTAWQITWRHMARCEIDACRASCDVHLPQ